MNLRRACAQHPAGRCCRRGVGSLCRIPRIWLIEVFVGSHVGGEVWGVAPCSSKLFQTQCRLDVTATATGVFWAFEPDLSPLFKWFVGDAKPCAVPQKHPAQRARSIDEDKDVAAQEQATQRDYFSEKKAQSLSDQEAIALIFEPGFTTRDDVSDISGRGVGMDVVRRQITRIGGFIEVESEVGQGTCFTLHLPISSAINAVLVFAIGERRFALSAKDVTRVAMVERDQLRTVHGGVCLQTDDGLCPLVDWSSPLGLEERGSPPDPMTVLLVRKGARRLAVWIDEVVGEREAVSRSLGDFLGGASLCRGVALTDSGAVVPMLDVMELAKRSSGDAQLEMERSKRSSYATVQNSRPGHRRTVLVVEDSEVTRSLVVSILKNRGYRVIEADDGHHGWARLQRHNVDLVLTDIQMPRMDGLELLKTIRSSEKYSALPVVILTTLGEAEDKKKAMGLGANGYLVKLSFQEEDLLEAVSRYIG